MLCIEGINSIKRNLKVHTHTRARAHAHQAGNMGSGLECESGVWPCLAMSISPAQTVQRKGPSRNTVWGWDVRCGVGYKPHLENPVAMGGIYQ